MLPRTLDPETPWYTPRALYYRESDSVEYIRKDVPTVHRRIDEYLTLVLSMRERKLIGFKLKGFRHFYLNTYRFRHDSKESHFLYMIQVLEEAMTYLGDDILCQDDRREAYRQASEIAQEDNVIFPDLTSVA
jgi:hypothetical protein